jgi:REP element-mobilizing transposase RayT
MSKIIGYMVTWTTYGSWLPGDERGYVRCGETLDGDKEVLERSKGRQENDTVRLNKKEKEIVKDTIIKESEKIGQTVEGISVYSNHVHLLLRTNSESIESAVSRYKSVSTRALWGTGRKGRIWTKRFYKSFCFDEESITREKKYITRHTD